MTDETPWVERPTRRTFIKRAGGEGTTRAQVGECAVVVDGRCIRRGIDRGACRRVEVRLPMARMTSGQDHERDVLHPRIL